MSKILTESQEQRDIELSEILNVPLKEIIKLPLATPEAVRVYDPSKSEKIDKFNCEKLYVDYKYLNFPAYLKTLMYTSVFRRSPELIELLKTTKNKVCLDFGSGVLTHSIALVENDNEVTALDVRDSKLMEFGLKRVNKRGLFVGRYWHDEELPKEQFDVVICSDCLEHVAHPVYELLRIKDSMKSGGILHLLVSTMRKPSSGHFNFSIDEWIAKGEKTLNLYFEKVGKTLYRKK